MPSYRTSITPHKKAAGRFVASVRRELQKALADEHVARGLTQASIAAELGVNRSVVHRQIVGHENLTLTSVAEIAHALGRLPHFALLNPAMLVGGNHPYTGVMEDVPTDTLQSASTLASGGVYLAAKGTAPVAPQSPTSVSPKR